MNLENLHTLIDRYEENYYMINGSDHDEKFKWGAVFVMYGFPKTLHRYHFQNYLIQL